MSKQRRERTPKAIEADLRRLIKEIADRRDKLHDLLDEIEGILDSSNDALEDLERGADSLSKYL